MTIGWRMWGMQWRRAWGLIGAQASKDHAALIGAPQLVHMRRGT